MSLEETRKIDGSDTIEADNPQISFPLEDTFPDFDSTESVEASGEKQPSTEEEGGDAMDAELKEFDSMIDTYLDDIVQHEVSSVIKVRVVEVHKDHVLVDLGDKAEGVIDIQEFFNSKGYISLSVGDEIDVLVEGRNEETGLIEVSHRSARARTAWSRLEKAHADGTPITGRVTRTVKSGLLVDVGTECFMPASHISDRRVNDLDEWVDKEIEVLVIDLDERKKRAVVSRRRLLETTKKAAQDEALGRLKEGETYQGTVRSIQNFGAFLDMGGVDAFLPREEISWDRGVAPASLLKVDAEIKVKVMQIDREGGRIRVSRKALRSDPWLTVESKYAEGTQVRGEIASITRFGAFVRLEEGLTGLVHVSDLSWDRDSQQVENHVKEGDSVRAVVLGVDVAKRRLSLGLKQLVDDPWLEAEAQFPKGSKVKGTVTNLATFGAFVRLTDNVEGLVHVSDFSWEEKVKHPGEVLKVGEEIEAVVLKTDRNARRISLGIKQLTESPVGRFMREHKVGAVVEGEVVRIIPAGAFVALVAAGAAGKIDGFLHVSQIDTERVEKPTDKLKVGDKVECKITKIERSSGKISLSRKALLEQLERDAIRQFGGESDQDKGVMKLGELLGNIKIEVPGAKADAPPAEQKAVAVAPAAEPDAEVSAPPAE